LTSCSCRFYGFIALTKVIKSIDTTGFGCRNFEIFIIFGSCFRFLFLLLSGKTSNMRLIADSGSTKTDWLLAEGSVLSAWKTQGINPCHQQPATIRHILQTELLPFLKGKTTPELRLSFYGSGCTAGLVPGMTALLADVFHLPDSQIEVAGDLLAAARAVCGHEEGIACILGTGANSCVYDGQNIVNNTPPLGYILGDEGSGASLGKMFLNALFKGDLPAELADQYLTETCQTYDDVIRHVYREPNANRYLASTSLFIIKHLDIKPLADIVEYNIEQFFVKNVCRYSHSEMPVAAVGSIADAYSDIYIRVANAHGFSVSKILKEPIDALAEYHSMHTIK